MAKRQPGVVQGAHFSGDAALATLWRRWSVHDARAESEWRQSRRPEGGGRYQADVLMGAAKKSPLISFEGQGVGRSRHPLPGARQARAETSPFDIARAEEQQGASGAGK
jgi:hypothetical protein